MALKPTYNSTMQAKAAGPYYGIDGWLRLVQLHMLYYTIMLLINIATYFSMLSGSDYQLLIMADIAISILQITLIIVSFILMVNKLMLFRVFYTILMVTFIISSVLMIASEGAMPGIYNIIVCSIWIAYLYKSERVKNTFRKAGQAKTDYELSLEQKKEEAEKAEEMNMAEEAQI